MIKLEMAVMTLEMILQGFKRTYSFNEILKDAVENIIHEMNFNN